MGINVFVAESHDIFRRGLHESLEAIDCVESVSSSRSLDDASQAAVLRDADLLILGVTHEGGAGMIRSARDRSSSRVLACASRPSDDDVMDAVAAGAIGVLDRDTLTIEALEAAMVAACAGNGVIDARLLGALLTGVARVARETLDPRGLSVGRLSERERQVLRLVADGHPTREVAQRMRYSERTIKSVIHDVVTKLNVRTRSQAVALAIREGLI